MQEALVAATDTPLAIAETCMRILELAGEAALKGNKGAVSDAGVAAFAAEAALNAALLNVDINAPSIKDSAYVGQATEKRRDLSRRAAVLREKAVASVAARLA
jgi:formiminotetrahydrofolate cyclodeaminase